MKGSADAVRLIKRFEGLRLQSYRDVAGIWTIGYGSTARGSFPHTIDVSEAERYLREDLEACEFELSRMLLRTINQRQFDALLSWIFNIGSSKAQSSTLIKKLNFGEPDGEVSAEFLKWNKATVNGVKTSMKGLTARREAERQLFLTGQLIF